MKLRFKHTVDGSREVTINGLTYKATWYRSGGRGTRAYWTIQTSDRDDYDQQGNDWYEPSWVAVKKAIAKDAENRLKGKTPPQAAPQAPADAKG